MPTHLLHVYGCHQCSVALLCNAFSRNVCNRYDKCRLACNVCGGSTIVLYGRSCDLCILGIFGRSLFVDLSGLAWYPTCSITSGKLPSSGLQCTLWFTYLCWPPQRRIFNITPSSAAQKYLLLLFCHLLAVSLPRLTPRGTATAHIVKGIKYP